jgi:Family of unknown function (DUF6459)
MPATLLRAQLSDHELLRRQHIRPAARRTLTDPAATARTLALAICEVEAGLRSASQLERICHPSLWAAVANRIGRAGGTTGQRRQRPPCPSPGAPAGAGGCGHGPPPGPASRIHRLPAGGSAGPLGAHRTPLLTPTPATTDRRGEPRIASPVIHSPRARVSRPPVPAATVPAWHQACTSHRPWPARGSSSWSSEP